MEKLGLNEIREKYLAFFESKEHLRHPSFSLVPENYVKMKELLVAQMKEFATNGATENELNAAKDYLLASYNLQTHETNVMKIYIAGLENEASQEKLDEICRLLLDNLVIINTEER